MSLIGLERNDIKIYGVALLFVEGFGDKNTLSYLTPWDNLSISLMKKFQPEIFSQNLHQNIG